MVARRGRDGGVRDGKIKDGKTEAAPTRAEAGAPVRRVNGFWVNSLYAKDSMRVLRTPDERFEGLPGYGFAPRYAELGDFEGGSLRMHYLDEGDAAGEVVLLLHGEPSWSYLYRKMILPLAAAGLRVVAPDLIGFGRSDKPAKRDDYSYARHLGWLTGLLDELGLSRITLFCQDWGGLLGLRLVAAQPERFARVVAANTALPTGDRPMPPAFKAWLAFSQGSPVLPVGKIISGGTHTKLSREVIAAYNAPFPDESYKAGARVLPKLVPSQADDPEAVNNRAAWERLKTFNNPLLTAFSDNDPVTKGGERAFKKLIPGASGQAHRIIKNAGHFLQEDRGEELAEVVLEFIRANPSG